MKKKTKTLLLLLSAIVLVCVGLYASLIKAAKRQLAALTYEPADMAHVSDGMHYGETNTGLVYVNVAVLVNDHTIENIQILEHKNGLGGAAESIVPIMIKKNSFAVDAVSGATLSSEAIKSAVSKALNDDPKKQR